MSDDGTEPVAPRRRTAAAAARLAAALLGLAVLGAVALRVRREPPAAEPPVPVAPAVLHYRIERNGVHAGHARISVDTTADEVRLAEALTTPGTRRDGPPLLVRSTVRLTRALRPLAFTMAVDDAALPLALDARVRGDSALELRITSEGTAAAPQVVPTPGPAYPPTALPLLAAFRGDRRVGGQLRVAFFDPASMSAQPLTLVVVAESLFVVSDSARRDVRTGRWVAARRDTVRAWLVRAQGSGTAVSFWTDALGRVVQATYAGGYVLRRTSREVATEGWE